MRLHFYVRKQLAERVEHVGTMLGHAKARAAAFLLDNASQVERDAMAVLDRRIDATTGARRADRRQKRIVGRNRIDVRATGCQRRHAHRKTGQEKKPERVQSLRLAAKPGRRRRPMDRADRAGPLERSLGQAGKGLASQPTAKSSNRNPGNMRTTVRDGHQLSDNPMDRGFLSRKRLEDLAPRPPAAADGEDSHAMPSAGPARCN